jgi:hypothetical protein
VTATKELCKRWDGSAQLWAQLCGVAKTVGDSISVLSLAPQDPPWSRRTSLTSPSGARAASAAGTGGERRRSGGAEEGWSQAQAPPPLYLGRWCHWRYRRRSGGAELGRRSRAQAGAAAVVTLPSTPAAEALQRWGMRKVGLHTVFVRDVCKHGGDELQFSITVYVGEEFRAPQCCR